jgi:predicted RNA binding protein YcfA (HicA-like mRNA interferase family)
LKRLELIRQLTAAGCVLHRHGARHDIYLNPATGQKQPVPRHAEIDDILARHIQKHLGLGRCRTA